MTWRSCCEHTGDILSCDRSGSWQDMSLRTPDVALDAPAALNPDNECRPQIFVRSRANMHVYDGHKRMVF